MNVKRQLANVSHAHRHQTSKLYGRCYIFNLMRQHIIRIYAIYGRVY